MMFLIKILLTTVIIGLGTYTIEWLKSDWLSSWDKKWVVASVAVIGAILVLVVELSSNGIGKFTQKPTITINTIKKEGEIELSIDIKGAVERMSINYPIIGRITNFQDLNSITDARTSVAKIVGGNTQNDVQNNLQISITDIKDNVKLQYKFFIEPDPNNIEIGGADKYELLYTWSYGSEKVQNTEWKMTKDDSATSKPNMRVVGTQVFDRVLTPEEIKEMYEAGPPQREF